MVFANNQENNEYQINTPIKVSYNIKISYIFFFVLCVDYFPLLYNFLSLLVF